MEENKHQCFYFQKNRNVSQTLKKKDLWCLWKKLESDKKVFAKFHGDDFSLKDASKLH